MVYACTSTYFANTCLCWQYAYAAVAKLEFEGLTFYSTVGGKNVKPYACCLSHSRKLIYDTFKSDTQIQDCHTYIVSPPSLFTSVVSGLDALPQGIDNGLSVGVNLSVLGCIMFGMELIKYFAILTAVYFNVL